MKMIVIDAEKMTSVEEAHSYLARELSFPDYYGNNLDALYDCLTEFCGSAFIVINNSKAMAENLGDYSKKLTKVFLDAAAHSGMYVIFR
ncbi:MAG: barstar family protein [Firmicutes bacterium]|nr:barstar family protein [Bacillota bacterium]